MNAQRPVLWEEQNLTSFPRLQREMPMVILPVGATEQHGPHAPMGTDTLTVYEIAKRVSALTGALVAPPIPYGSSLVHANFPGTISLSPQTLIQVVGEVCDWFWKWGMRKILLLNGHGVNFPPLWVALENVRYKYPDVQITVITWWDTSREAQKHMFKDQPESSFHFAPSVAHAGLGETACVLACRPDLIQMDRAVDGPREMKGLVFKYEYSRLFPDGVKAGGRPGEATAEIGEEILQETAKALAELVRRGLEEEIPSP
jgi:creatinine amidohydrolase